MTLTVVGGGLVVETRPEAPSVEDLEALLDGDGGRGGRWHWVLRVNGVTAICGAKCNRDDVRPADASKDEDCRVCDRLLAAYLNGGGWEGSGRRPGRELTDELRRHLGGDA